MPSVRLVSASPDWERVKEAAALVAAITVGEGVELGEEVASERMRERGSGSGWLDGWIRDGELHLDKDMTLLMNH